MLAEVWGGGRQVGGTALAARLGDGAERCSERGEGGVRGLHGDWPCSLLAY